MKVSFFEGPEGKRVRNRLLIGVGLVLTLSLIVYSIGSNEKAEISYV
tara:strand:- start:200 stop:340 length:141 start_codon:yes stop_codon:yes gene_type:complete